MALKTSTCCARSTRTKATLTAQTQQTSLSLPLHEEQATEEMERGEEVAKEAREMVKVVKVVRVVVGEGGG